MEQVVHLLEGPEAAVLRVSRLPEGGGDHLHEVGGLLETTVLLHQYGDLQVVEPITLALVEFLHQLGKELAVVEVIVEVDVASTLHTDEPPAARGIHQRLHLVGCADERGVALVLSDGLAVEWAELHIACREQVFQDDVLTGGGLETKSKYTLGDLKICRDWIPEKLRKDNNYAVNAYAEISSSLKNKMTSKGKFAEKLQNISVRLCKCSR